jgi:hypothetical protein
MKRLKAWLAGKSQRTVPGTALKMAELSWLRVWMDGVWMDGVWMDATELIMLLERVARDGGLRVVDEWDLVVGRK